VNSRNKVFRRIACATTFGVLAFGSVCHAYTPAATPDSGQARHLEVALVCDGATPPSREVWHAWDARFAAGRVDRRCTDSSERVLVLPLKATVEFDKFAESKYVAVQLSADDGRAVSKLFSDALKRVPKGESRPNLVLIDGKIVVSSFISGPFEGTILDIGVDSEESANRLRSILAGKAP